MPHDGEMLLECSLKSCLRRQSCAGYGSLLVAAWFAVAPQSNAATYNVGPGQPLATPSDVAWESLAAGDTVRIHWKAQPYYDKWVICRRGTAEQPITVEGVPGPNGERPVIDGNNASTRSQLNYWGETRGIIKIGGASIPTDVMPAHIVIDGLEIRAARPPNSFVDDIGNPQTYSNNASSIYVEKGEHITIRNCVMEDCGNGLFVAVASSEVMVEGNHIYGNGIVGSIYEHNSYTEATGITFQYNHYGPLLAGAGGNNLKDRSAGTVIRYNWIESGNRQLDLVDAEGSVELQQDPSYRSTFVYGNVLIEPDNSGNRQIIHYGGDSGNTAGYRKGTLYLHHNTIISTRAGRTTLLRLSTNDESADCRNNIIFVMADGDELELLSDAGALTFTNNWIKTGWVNSFNGSFSGSVTGGASSIMGAAPGFINAALQNYRLADGSSAINAGAALHAATQASHSPLREYRKHRRSEMRRPLGTADLGAFEFSPYGAWQSQQFGADAENDLVSGETADPDLDLIPNLMEFAFELDPNNPAETSPLSTEWVTIGDDRFFAIEFPRRPQPTGLAYRAEVSENLITWLPGTVYTDGQTGTTTAHTTDASIDGRTLVRLIAPVGSSPIRFIRIVVSYQ